MCGSFNSGPGAGMTANDFCTSTTCPLARPGSGCNPAGHNTYILPFLQHSGYANDLSQCGMFSLLYDGLLAVN